ncbi:Ig-like domain (group 3) [Granulicella rosea]|uniref:Ig-like domain (Group 3) n=1 Tax=Granulicella rosea TaxID=474952 RepID=A0A239MNH5_9BACT|nr:Ig-like domain repeat protein [Granulicella rosea]SNT44215.1 Ig-like domain (group 3) [Granulicella rosea]
MQRIPGFSLLALLVLSYPMLHAQTTPPVAVPDPVATVAAGTGTAGATTCATGIPATSGVSYGDGCAPATAGLAAPQGVSVDRLGNLYIADYTDRLVRVVYAGGTQLAAAITAANSGYAISATRSAPAPAPVVGNIYTIAGLGTTPAALTATNASGGYYCANYAATGQPVGLNSLGDGCPAASAPIGARAVQPDSDGNLFFVDYTDSRVRVFCVNCAATTNAAQLIALENPGVTPVNGAMYTVAGYAGGYRDAAIGFGSATAATVSVALLRSPTSISVSASDDLYIGDQGNNAVRLLYNGGASALALLTAEGVTPVKGYVYTIAGAGCVSAAIGKTGSVTTANSCLTTTPTDSVLANASGVNTPWSVYLDPNQNLFIGDGGNGRVRVIYGGVANPLTLTGSLTTGDIYTFAGTGSSTANGITPAQLALSATATAAEGIAGDGSGNLFIVDYNRAVIYEVYASTGTLTAIVGSTPATTLAAGAYCNGLAAGPTMTNAFGDGCPATQSRLTAPRGDVAVDTAGNLYFGDSTNSVVQRYSYAAPFAATTTGGASAAQMVAFTFNSASSATVPSTTTAEFSLTGTSTCALAAVSGATCAANVAFNPTHPGLRTGAVTLGAAVGSEMLSGNGLGAALNVDPATTVSLGTTLQPAGVAIDNAGLILVSDLASKSLIRYAGATPTTLATGFTAPSGVAVDGAGNLFVADSTANTVREIPISGASAFTLVSGLNAPHGLAFDMNGNLLIANTGANSVVTVSPNGVLATATVSFTGLSGPQAVAADGFGNLYVADTGNARVLRLTPAGVQTVVATVASNGLAVDAAGDLFLFSGAALNEYPAGSATPVAVASGLATPRAVALDAKGNIAIADSGKPGVLTLNRAVASYTFTASPASTAFTLTSSGNAAFVPASPFLTNSDTTHFTVAAATTGGCSGTLAVGTICNLNATFSSATAGTFTDNVGFSGNATNAPGLTLTGTNTAESTSTTFTVSATSATYGASLTFTATVKGAATTPTTGTVAFLNGTTTLGTASVGAGGIASAAIVPPAGALSITAVFTPAGINYAASASTAQAVTIAKAVLTVTAANVSRQFGTANPSFTYTINGFVNGDTQASATTGAPTETSAATATSPQGSYPITIAAGTLAAGNYSFTLVNGTLTVTPATPAITLAASTTSTYAGTPVVLSVTLSSSVGTPTGTVNFLSGTSSLGTATVSNGAASLTTSALALGVDAVTAVYSGDTAFSPVTSAAISITVAAAFGVSASATALTFPHNYQEAQSFFTVNPGGRTDTLSFACTGLPAKIGCTFTPSTLGLAGLSGPQSVTLLVSNSGASAVLEEPPAGPASRRPVFAGLFVASLLLAARRRKMLPRLLMFALAAGLISGALSGCGSSVANTQQAVGTYPFNVTVSSGSTALQTIPFTLTVQ